MSMKKVLMVCTGNMDRSPTAAMLLAEMCAPMWVTSAGTESWAKNQITLELVEEADIICVMEEAHQRLIRERFGEAYVAKVLVLDIPDNYICWEAGLVNLLKPRLRAALGIALPRQQI
ncbi:MAG: phosphotyrosine protein phosphatase [Deltaproteobacteria bacterium]|nr:phosphotyrosine protein phosphatase [Deltaproteobacteria bacterium]